MKTTLIFAMSINGFIAESDNSVHWSDDIWKAYQEVSWKVWNMIVGRKTYELMIQSGEIETLGLRNLVIISKQSDITTHHVEHTPEDALKYLVSIGETEVIICGGTSIATYLLDKWLLDEIIIDIEPTLISEWIPMFWVLKNPPNLQLLDTKKLWENTVRIHYIIS